MASERKTLRVNEQIRSPRVRVIGADGSQLGILPIDQALAAAREAELDLVEVASDQDPPVCRIIDFGKYKYQQSKRQHRSHAHRTRVKEIRVRPRTSSNDVAVKVRRAREFLEHKDKVILSVVFKGRELAHIEEGERVMQSMLEQLADICKIESPPTKHGRRLVCTIAPK